LPSTKEVWSNGNWNFHHSRDAGGPASRTDRGSSSRNLQQERLRDPDPLHRRNSRRDPAALRRGDRLAAVVLFPGGSGCARGPSGAAIVSSYLVRVRIQFLLGASMGP